LQLPGVAVDVDNPEDLQQLLAQPSKSSTQRLVQSWVIDGRLFANGGV
jgi:2-phospho-L-lactate guanylyltransferase (CobY/MobA/RfbA family)